MKRFLLACLLMLGAVPAFAQTSLTFSSAPGEYIGMGQTVTWTTSNSNLQISGTRSAIHASVTDSNGTSWKLDLTAPIGEELMPGTYPGAQEARYVMGRAPGLEFNAGNRVCSSVFGSFAIRQIKFDTMGALTRLEATALQRCENDTAPPLALEIRYRSSPHMFSVDSPAGMLTHDRRQQSYYNDTSTFQLRNTLAAPTLDYQVAGQRTAWYMELSLPPGKTRFQKGTLYTRRRAEGAYGGMTLSTEGRMCSEGSAFFNILEVAYGPDNHIDKFYADFNHYCTPDRTGPVLKGRIRYVRGI